MPFNVPDPANYRGTPLRKFLEDCAAFFKRSRLIAGPGVALDETPGGIVLRIVAFGLGLAIIKTAGTVSARSGTTPGNGDATLVTWNGTSLGTGQAIGLRNIYGSAGSSGKYGFAVMLFGLYWLVNLEC